MVVRNFTLRLARFAVMAAMAFTVSAAIAAEKPKSIRLDYAYYNPLSLVLKEKGWVEEDFKRDGIAVEWVLSLGSNKALEFLNAGSIDLGSSAGSAALLARANGNPIKAIYIYSKPEWTALVTAKDSPIKTVADLKGKSIAVTRGTDPHIFLLRALARAGLSSRDVKMVLLQHPDGKTALSRGEVDAWAGLDPYMAQIELEEGARLFFRDPDLNTYGFLDVREEFATAQPDLVLRVLSLYEKARAWALANPDEFRAIVAKGTKQTDAVARLTLERNDLGSGKIGETQRLAIVSAGGVLKESGIIPPDTDIEAVSRALVDPSFVDRLAAGQQAKQ
ncbi:MAG TPA: aliphatic sulfonate ABC transporter substrate-binding protein [Stellaceae bacterium]|nr:aliphatic sulfonate ABC transporter substrate-binding protein [Stellaceae bacterium]